MATDAYWEHRRGVLFLPEHGSLAYGREMAERLRISLVLSSLNNAALEFKVLDLEREARECLGYLPLLRSALTDSNLLKDRIPFEQSLYAAYLRSVLHVGTWVQTGEMDTEMARAAYVRARAMESWHAPDTLELMLLQLESNNVAGAVDDYRQYERKPISLPLANIRFSGNPRSVLFACVASETDADRDLATRAFDAFRKSVCATEDIHSRRFMFRDQLARVIRAAHQSLGRPYDLDSIIPLLR